jgi:hypothetical protein
MLTTISSFFTSAFVVDYFKDAVVGLLVVIYFVVLICTRPHLEKGTPDLPDQNSQSMARVQAPPVP